MQHINKDKSLYTTCILQNYGHVLQSLPRLGLDLVFELRLELETAYKMIFMYDGDRITPCLDT